MSGVIERIQEALSKSDRPGALDIVYDSFDEFLLASRIDEAKVLLREFAETDFSEPSVYLSVLTATLPWDAQLKEERALVYARAFRVNY